MTRRARRWSQCSRRTALRTAGCPDGEELPDRLRGVLRVAYRSSTMATQATDRDRLVRGELCAEAIRLGELLCRLMPDDAEVWGLSALMLLHDARRGCPRGSERAARRTRRAGPLALGSGPYPGGPRRLERAMRLRAWRGRAAARDRAHRQRRGSRRARKAAGRAALNGISQACPNRPPCCDVMSRARFRAGTLHLTGTR
jgi:hypothetical protein